MNTQPESLANTHKNRLYREQLITTDDLQELKLELLNEIKQLLKEQSGASTRKWLKSYEVRELLKISTGTLQNLRLNGTLPYTKIGGVIYYDAAEIQLMLKNGNKAQASFR